MSASALLKTKRWDKHLLWLLEAWESIVPPGGMWAAPAVWRYGLALLMVLVSTQLRVLLLPLLGTLTPFQLSFLTTVLATLFLGLGPGVMCCLLGSAAVEYFVLGGLAHPAGATVIRLTTANIIGGLFVLVVYSVSLAVRKTRQSEGRLRAFAAATFEGVVETENGRILDCNEQIEVMLGRTREELRGMHIAELIAPEDRERVLANVRTNCESVVEHVLLRKDGARVTVEAHGRPAAGGSRIRYTAIRDITARKRTEEELRVSEERLRLAQAAGQIGIFDYSPVTGELHWDERLRELWGLGPDEPVTYEYFFAALHPEDRVRIEQAMQKALDPGGAGTCALEYRLVREGKTRWFAARCKTIFREGRAVRLVGTVQEVTERKEFQGELERLVVERTAKLHEVIGDLEHYSYSLTHDMRAPLRAMRGFAEVVEELTAPNPDPEVRLSVRRIIGAAQRMDTLITDALDYSKSVREEFSLAPVDLHALLAGMLETYPEFLEHRTQISVENRLPRVLGNEAALIQVLSNLLGNAVKFVEPGSKPEVRIRGERLAAGAAAAEGLTDGGEWVRVSIEDKGIGISPRFLPRIFHMFSRGTSNYPGTGIGLALVRKVMQRMGGKVGVESEPGKGSRFWLLLRAAPESAGVARAAGPAVSAEACTGL